MNVEPIDSSQPPHNKGDTLDSTTQGIALIILLLVFVVNGVVRRRDNIAQRRIRAYDVLPAWAGASIEANRPLHFSLGSASIGDDTTLLALVGKEFVYYMTRQVAISDAAPIFTVANSAVLPLAMDTLRRGYLDAGYPQPLRDSQASWYPAGSRSLAFAAMLTTLQDEEKVSRNLLVGRYGQELALVLDSAARHQNPSVAVSDQLDGQAVAYALADEVLIGEEIFAAPAYLSNDPIWIKRNVITDVLRWLLILALLVLVISGPILNLTGGS